MNFLQTIQNKIEARERLTFEDGVRLYRTNDLPALGTLAQFIRRRMNSNCVYYSVNLHLNYSNICSLRCLFCAFARRPEEAGGYTYSPEEIEAKVRDALAKWPVNEIHITGGHHPELPLDYYLEMIRRVRLAGPKVFIKAFTAPEIDDMAVRFQMSYGELLLRFKEAGLDGLPGGGAEIFAPRVRKKICADKIPAETWLEIHKVAHTLGLRSNATMLYGHIETEEERVDHVLRLRALQDQTHGFESFIPLAYNAENTPMEKLGEAGGYTDLKVYAVSRLLLDNIRHLKSHWVTIGLKMAQVALSFGVDDLGGTNLNEKIMHDAGSETPMDFGQDELESLILAAGYEPCLVDSSYKNAERSNGEKNET